MSEILEEPWVRLERAWPQSGMVPRGVIVLPDGSEGEEFVGAWKNDVYTVWQFEVLGSGWEHLSIKRNDRGAVLDWRHLQQIKDEICGPDREAVELFPAASRLLDAANQRHLWVYPAGKCFPLGAWERSVGTPEEAAAFGGVNRAFQPGLTI